MATRESIKGNDAVETSPSRQGGDGSGIEYSHYELLAIKNALITTLSTFLSHYFTSQFLQGRWLVWDLHATDADSSPESVNRKVLEIKSRFLYTMREAAQSLLNYPDTFRAMSAFEEDKINDALEIISTPEREWMDILLNRATEVMAADMNHVELTEGSTGQFLRRVIRMVRHEMDDPEHLKFMYLFVVWKMPDVLFNTSMRNMIRRREIRALLSDARVPKDLVNDFNAVRGGGGLFPKDGDEEEQLEQPVDEGWDLEMQHIKAQEKKVAKKKSGWRRLFGGGK